MSQQEAESQHAALLAGDVLDAMRCIVATGVSIREFEYALPRRRRETILVARTPAAARVIEALLAAGQAVSVAPPHPDERRTLSPLGA